MLNVDQIQARLKTLSQPALFQAGIDNQHDAVMFGLINSENDRRQQMQQAAMASQAGQQPPVNQQDLFKMAPSSAPNMGAGIPLQGPGSAAQMMPPTNTASALPENTGIGALPAPNLKKMADGGITGYAEGGLDSYTPQIFAEAKRLGIDPTVALNLFKTESAGDKNATSGKGAAGLGQLMKPAAQEMGLSEEERYDPQKNISASLGYFKKQLNRFGSYDKAAAAYNWGPGHLKEHLKKNDGVLNINGLPKETASYLTKLMPGSQANAAEIPQAAAPAQAGAPAQATAPTYTPEGVEAIGQRLDLAREELRNAKRPGYLQSQKDPNAAVNYQNAQNLVSNLQRTYEEGMASAHPELTQAAMIGNPANPQGGGRVLPATTPYSQQIAQQVAAPDIARQNVTKPTSNIAGPGDAGWGMDLGQEPVPGTPTTPTTPTKTNVATTQEPAKGGRDWNDFLLNLGLGMMAGTSPYALQNIGNAGIGALKQEQEAKRAALEERKLAAEEALNKQHGAYFAANAKYIEDQRGPMGALSLAQKDYAEWTKNNFGATPEQQAAAYKGFVDSAFKNSGIINPRNMTPEAQAALSKYGTS